MLQQNTLSESLISLMNFNWTCYTDLNLAIYLYTSQAGRQAGRLTTTSLLKGAAITDVTHLITKQEYKYRNGHYLLAKFPSTGFNKVQWVLWQSPTVHILLQDCHQQHCKWLAMPAMCSSFPTSKLTKQERYLSSLSY